MPERLFLSTLWQLRQHDPEHPIGETLAASEGWIPAQVPGSVHEALLAAGRIPDPFYDRNEREVQWVGEADWIYRCEVMLTDSQAAQQATLCLDGLDTVASVWFNGVLLCTSDNMFVPLRVPVSGSLHAGSNALVIHFASALRHGQALEAKYGQRAVWNTDSSRVYVRKAQYHYGWDWGPCLITAGPWRSIWLEFGAARIADVYCPAVVTDDLAVATLPVAATLEAAEEDLEALRVQIQLTDPSGSLVAEATLPAALDLHHTFTLAQPKLWWPAHHGHQHRYRLAVTLLHDVNVQDEREIQIGLRRLRLVQEPVLGEEGTSFLFEVNNQALFCGGANWIPADNLLSRVSHDQYRELLTAAVDANMVMLRVWGGGVYEHESFYELCDELGLLVWQDFMFACGLYPAHQAFLDSVRQEAEAQLRRLRNHVCIALWCGNNEDYLLAQSQGAYNPSVAPETDTVFPARLIYERLLPEVCDRLDPSRAYWPGSPYTGTTTLGGTVGDRHVWDVWHGGMAPYQQYRRYAGRFVSEFGMQAAPASETLREALNPDEAWPQSRSMDYHNKAPDGAKRLAGYLAENLRLSDQRLETYSYQTQLLQAEALSHAYRAWRRRWAGPGRYSVAGALVWQLNDCWPVISWAVIDSALRPKAALYAIRRELAPLCIGLAAEEGGVSAWAVNGSPEALEATLVVRMCALDGAVTTLHQQEVAIPALGVAEFDLVVAPLPDTQVVAVQLRADETVIARAVIWPEPLKYLKLLDPGLTITYLGNDQLELHCTRPAKGVWLAAGDDVRWEDNNLDLLPDETRVITAHGLGGRQVSACWYSVEHEAEPVASV